MKPNEARKDRSFRSVYDIVTSVGELFPVGTYGREVERAMINLITRQGTDNHAAHAHIVLAMIGNSTTDNDINFKTMLAQVRKDYPVEPAIGRVLKYLTPIKYLQQFI